MLALSKLNALLTQMLSVPGVRAAILLTPSGQLVSVACEPYRPKDEIRIVVGQCGEVWQESKEQGFALADSEVRDTGSVPARR